VTEATLLARRLERYRESVRVGSAAPDAPPAPLIDRGALARALAAAIGGEVETTSRGSVVWRS
jgi:hypothetical protein